MEARQALVEVTKVLMILNATYGNREFPLSGKDKTETLAGVWAQRLCRFAPGTIEQACAQACNHKDPPNLVGIESLCKTIDKHRKEIARAEEQRQLESKVANPRVANYYQQCQRRILLDKGKLDENFTPWLGEKRGRVPTIEELDRGREKLKKDGFIVQSYRALIENRLGY